ncbi:MAG: hypothetical protein KatS3mg110_2753 [Pirellulaceae bacterium]|nr:MAG: hypothetical protein KatS3mg110_2753 [Pirellulaceae bacterium]
MNDLGSPELHERCFGSLVAEAQRVVEEILQQVKKCGWGEHELFGIHLALEEAITNAMKHGNRWDPAKRVTVRWQASTERFSIEITDEGNGFDPDAVPDPTLDENLEQTSGRGLVLMRNFMNEVRYNARGNSVLMIKYREKTIQDEAS